MAGREQMDELAIVVEKSVEGQQQEKAENWSSSSVVEDSVA